ncbi:hypothetical protein ACTXPG_15025, partial [Glutamicibacter arilaitensis]|uniref:hypothetical protein n=2 Tax=Glutamicibacter arilaitensis TaxID=256701 RepID=UPI003FD29333
ISHGRCWRLAGLGLGYTLNPEEPVNFDSPVALNRLETDFSVSFKTAGNMVGSLDGDFNIVPMEYVDHPLETSVKSGEFQFHMPFIKRISKDLTRLKISSNLTISIPDDGRTGRGSISVTTSPILEDRYQDIGFFISCTDNGQFQIGSRTSLVSFAPIEDRHLANSHLSQ